MLAVQPLFNVSERCLKFIHLQAHLGRHIFRDFAHEAAFALVPPVIGSRFRVAPPGCDDMPEYRWTGSQWRDEGGAGRYGPGTASPYFPLKYARLAFTMMPWPWTHPLPARSRCSRRKLCNGDAQRHRNRTGIKPDKESA